MSGQTPGGVLQGRIALITGSGRGLGREIARAYARAGAKLVLASRMPSELQAVADELAGLDCEVLARPCDVTRSAQVTELVSAAVDRFRIDVLVNNAGVTHGAASHEIRTILDVDEPFWDLVFGTNCKGAYPMMRSVIPVMVTQRTGRIINITSTLSQRDLAGNIPYGPPKAGLEALTLCVATEFGPQGLRVNLLHPGGPAATGVFKEHYRPHAGSVLLSPEIIGPPAVWLASDAAADVHGQIIVARTWQPPGAAPETVSAS